MKANMHDKTIVINALLCDINLSLKHQRGIWI